MASTVISREKKSNHETDRKRSNMMIGKAVLTTQNRDTGNLNPVKINSFATDRDQTNNPLSKVQSGTASNGSSIGQSLINQIYQMSKQTSVGDRRFDYNFPANTEIE